MYSTIHDLYTFHSPKLYNKIINKCESLLLTLNAMLREQGVVCQCTKYQTSVAYIYNDRC